MPRKKSTEVTGQQIEDLTSEVARLTDEVRVLRDAIDELREELQWAVRNSRPLPAPMRLTSMALDPTASDFGKRLNAVSPETVQRLRDELANQDAPSQPQHVPSVSTVDANDAATNPNSTRQTRQQSFWSADD